VVGVTPAGRTHAIASHYDDVELNSPNDVCADSAGVIYFTDPTYGRRQRSGEEAIPRLGYQGLYAVRGDESKLQLLRDDFAQPNGLCFSPDERVLYVNDTERAHIRAIGIDGAGRVTSDDVFAAGIGDGAITAGPVDGMKCDEAGNVWISGPGGIWIFDNQGCRLGTLEVAEVVGNFAWGGRDRTELLICASSSVYWLPTRVRGRLEPFMVPATASSPGI
jgi:gluconolactonase